MAWAQHEQGAMSKHVQHEQGSAAEPGPEMTHQSMQATGPVGESQVRSLGMPALPNLAWGHHGNHAGSQEGGSHQGSPTGTAGGVGGGSSAGGGGSGAQGAYGGKGGGGSSSRSWLRGAALCLAVTLFTQYAAISQYVLNMLSCYPLDEVGADVDYPENQRVSSLECAIGTGKGLNMGIVEHMMHTAHHACPTRHAQP